MKKLITILFFAMLVLTDTASALPTYKIGNNITLIHSCASCTYNNISYVIAPNSSIILSNAAMSKEQSVYNYTLPEQVDEGIYSVCGYGDVNGNATEWCYDLTITADGYENNPNLILASIFLLSLIALVFLVVGIFLYLKFQESDSE